FEIRGEEALYELPCASTFLGSLGNKFRRLIHLVAFWPAMREAQILLHAKSTDEQIGSVGLPRGGCSTRPIQAFGQTAVQQAGYDLKGMLREWKIVWRRKGI